VRLSPKQALPIAALGAVSGYEWHGWLGVPVGAGAVAALFLVIRRAGALHDSVAPSIGGMLLALIVGVLAYFAGGLGAGITMFVCIWVGAWLGLSVAARRRQMDKEVPARDADDG
jgi:hypothetical protein